MRGAAATSVFDAAANSAAGDASVNAKRHSKACAVFCSNYPATIINYFNFKSKSISISAIIL